MICTFCMREIHTADEWGYPRCLNPTCRIGIRNKRIDEQTAIRNQAATETESKGFSRKVRRFEPS